MRYVNMPLFEDEFYSYSISLENQSYIIKIYYNRRERRWYMDIFYPDEVPLILGMALVPDYPMAMEYPIDNFNGFFWLEENPAIGTNKIDQYPRHLHKYYRFFYIYDPQ